MTFKMPYRVFCSKYWLKPFLDLNVAKENVSGKGKFQNAVPDGNHISCETADLLKCDHFKLRGVLRRLDIQIIAELNMEKAYETDYLFLEYLR